MASLSTSASFRQTFQALKSEIIAALDRPDAQIADISKLMTQLKAQLAGVLPSLPAYDQRIYELQVRELETIVAGVRAKSRPKSKFTFSKPSGSVTQAAVSPDLKADVPLNREARSHDDGTGDSNGTAGPSSLHRKVSGRKGGRILLSELDVPAGSESWTLSLEDLEDCTIDLRLASDPSASCLRSGLSSLHARKLKNCTVYAGHIEGSALLHDLEVCTVVASVQQFRIHTSHHCDISLYIPSEPIIESCSDLMFRSMPPETLNVGVSDRPPNRVAEVADFSWIKPTPSPNWKYIDGPKAEGLEPPGRSGTV